MSRRSGLVSVNLHGFRIVDVQRCMPWLFASGGVVAGKLDSVSATSGSATDMEGWKSNVSNYEVCEEFVPGN